MIEIAIAIAVVNMIVALIFVGWCNKKIKDYTNKDNWK